MIARHRTAALARRRSRSGHSGFTLLEVLVSLGIIIGALAGIAALLPAAGSRLADATEIDRAGTMAANARADLANRGLISASFWQNGRNATVFGEGLPAISHSTIATANVSARIDPSTGFQLRDAVQATVTGSSLVVGGGFDPGVCYGCMLSSPSTSRSRGDPVRVTTVVFRKPAPEVKQFTLTPRGGVYDIGVGAAVASDRSRFLSGCSWVLSVGSGEPQWLQIASSWTSSAPGQTTGAATGTSSLTLVGGGGGPLQVFGFDGLLRLDERTVNLE